MAAIFFSKAAALEAAFAGEFFGGAAGFFLAAIFSIQRAVDHD
ncbi:MAG: hypothetical protein ABIQ84_10380 [Usitatibacter sp.]